MDSVYEQLKEQGRLDFLEDYKEILLPEIEYSVRHKYYGDQEIATQSAHILKYNYPYGGTVANTTVSGKNALCTYLDFDDSYYYILKKQSSYYVSSIVEAIVGSLPHVGTAFTILFTLQTITNGTTCKKIIDAGGYSKTLTLRDPVTRDYSSVLLGWDTYPYATTYALDIGQQVYVKEFPEHNPFAAEK